MDTDLWELFALVAVSILGVLLVIVVLAGIIMAARAVATWFSSGQWRKDIWR